MGGGSLPQNDGSWNAQQAWGMPQLNWGAPSQQQPPTSIASMYGAAPGPSWIHQQKAAYLAANPQGFAADGSPNSGLSGLGPAEIRQRKIAYLASNSQGSGGDDGSSSAGLGPADIRQQKAAYLAANPQGFGEDGSMPGSPAQAVPAGYGQDGMPVVNQQANMPASGGLPGPKIKTEAEKLAELQAPDAWARVGQGIGMANGLLQLGTGAYQLYKSADAYDFQKNMSLKNLANQTKSYNGAMEDRIRNGYSREYTAQHQDEIDKKVNDRKLSGEL
jgi:hypothetical protein